MKKALWICWIVSFLLVAQAVPSTAGSFIVGAKGWYTIWDSAILDWLEKDISISFQQNRVQFQADRDPGTGYMAGPLFGYLSDDGKWSVSVVPMVLSSFSQDWNGTASGMSLRGDADLTRRDYDLAITYQFAEHFKAFAGYKFQDMELDFRLTTTTILGTQTDTFDVEARAHIPSFGVGAVWPLVQGKFVIGGQAGVLLPMMDMEITNQSGVTEDILPHSGLGFNVEGNLTWQPLARMILQLGYRYQMFEFDARGPGRTETLTSRDITHGPTLSLVYAF